MRTYLNLIGVGILLLIVYIMVFYRKEKLNVNYDSGAGIRVPGQEWTQPQMIGPTGTEGDASMTQNLVYDKYKKGYVHNLYDYGNIFHIPTSVTDASDTTEDNLQAYLIERSRYSKR